MKAPHKEIKKIHVEDHSFYYVLKETRDHVKLRIYSALSKTTFVDIFFTWGDNYLINFYKPSVCAAIIKYAKQNGWRYWEPKRMMEIASGSFLLEELSLEAL